MSTLKNCVVINSIQVDLYFLKYLSILVGIWYNKFDGGWNGENKGNGKLRERV